MFALRCLPQLPRALTRGIRKTPLLPYTSEQQCQVLDVLNTSSEFQLRKLLGPSLGTKVMYLREQAGPLASIEAMFDIKGASVKSVLKFCEMILSGRTEEKTTSLRLSALSPAISQERMNAIQTVVNLDITPTFATIAVMDRDYKLLQMNQVQFQLDPTKFSIPALYEAAEQAYPKFANLGDVYVMEQSTTNLQQMTVGKLVKPLLQGIISTMLNFGEPEQPKVVHMKKTALSNMFGLNLSNERIACEPTVRSLMQKREVIVPEAIMYRFEKESPVNREYFGLSILRCLAMLRLRGDK